jgi:hypothetical protein
VFAFAALREAAEEDSAMVNDEVQERREIQRVKRFAINGLSDGLCSTLRNSKM